MKKEEIIYKLFFTYSTINNFNTDIEYYTVFDNIEDIPEKENIKFYIEDMFKNITFIKVIKLIKETLVEEEIEY